MNERYLIIETQEQELDILKEEEVEEGKSEIILGGIFSQWDQLNNNKRVYPKEPLVREVKKLQGLISQGRLLGELDHPPTPRINLDRVSHKVIDLQVDERNRSVVGKVSLLDTPNGKIAKAIVKSGTKLAISSRATGELEKKEDGTFIVGDNLNLLTYDLVLTPGVENAILDSLRESLGGSSFVFSEEEWEKARCGLFRLQDEQEIKERMKKLREERIVNSIRKLMKV